MSELKPVDCLPTITEEDRQFLHYNPNTQDVVDWVAGYALVSIDEWNRRAQPAEQEISADEKFCDGHCSWAEHHPDCSLSAPPAQPVAHLWQHGETGRTRIVMPDQIFTADANWLLVGPMYLHPAAAPADAAPSVAPEPVAWLSVDCIGERYLCFSKPMDNDTVTPLFAHPPRAPSVAPEPVAWKWQHDETGRTGFVGAGFDRVHWEEHNPRLKIIAPCFTHPPRAPLTEEQSRDLVKECGLDWQRGYMPLFEGDPTNRYAVLVEAVEAAHGIGGK